MRFITSKNIPKFIMILPIAGILVATILFSTIAIYTIKNNFEKQKQNITKKFFNNLQKTTKQRVELTYNIIDALYKDQKDYNKTIKLIQKVLSKMRWEKRGYIFVFDYKGNVIYHINKNYINTNRWNVKRNNVYLVQLIVKSALNESGGTYVKYVAYNPDGSPKQKVSFVKTYKPLKIVIGNGVYLDFLDKKLLTKTQDNQKLLNELVKNIVIASLAILVLMLIVVFYFASMLKNLFRRYDDEINREKAMLFKKANFDLLTSLHNRGHFLLELKEYLTLAKREDKNLAVVFIDIDHFKEINDTLGHQYGDKVLKIVAKRLLKNVRSSDIVARFGGDEFVVLLYDVTNEEITDLIQRTLSKIKDEIVLGKRKYYVSASAGVSISPDDSEDANTLIKYADTAMYKAKKAGKDRFEFYSYTMSKEASKRIILKNSLHQALEKEEFVVYFQPQIDRHNKLMGMEALIRWKHPIKGLVSPFEFIPLAIEIGLIDKIDLWVIEQSIIQHKKWSDKGYDPGIISCNITMYQLEKSDFSQELEELLKKHKFNPKNLNLELTEENIMKNPEKSIKMVNKIKQLGISINIDDFGTGYSSLAYLKKFPISKLKIDRSFIKDIPQDKDDMAITKTIISLAQNLKLGLVAEGVETKIQQEFIVKNSEALIQGYFYSRPIPADKFEEKFFKS